MNQAQQYIKPEVPKWLFTLLNQLYELETKLSAKADSDPGGCLRNVIKIKDSLEEQAIFYEDPMGQPFNETRTDLEATISGVETEDLRVVEVIKPIIRQGTREMSRILQKGIVVVESKHL